MSVKKYDLLSQEGLRRRQDSDEKMRKSMINGVKTKHRIDELTGERERRVWLERSNSYLERMYKEKTDILKQVSTCRSITSLVRNRWDQILENLDLTRPGAEVELKNLLEEVKREKKLWSNYSFDPPEWWKRLTGEEAWSPHLSEFGQTRTSSLLDLENGSLGEMLKEPSQKNPFLNALELKEAQRQQDMELERRLNESELALIVSSLEVLITHQMGYGQARSHL